MVNDMDYKSSIRKHGIIIAICAICSILVVAGTSYALFFQTNVNTDNQVLKTGKLNVKFGDNTPKITIDPITPVTDEVGLSDNSYSSTVTIENTGSLDANYALKLNNDLESGYTPINNQYVKVAVFVGDTAVFKTEEHPEEFKRVSELSNDEGMYLLYNGSLDRSSSNGSSSNTITVRIWLDKDTPATEKDKYVSFELVVDSVVDESKTEEGQANS